MHVDRDRSSRDYIDGGERVGGFAKRMKESSTDEGDSYLVPRNLRIKGTIMLYLDNMLYRT